MPNTLVNGYLILPDLSMYDLLHNTIIFCYLRHRGLSDYLVAVSPEVLEHDTGCSCIVLVCKIHTYQSI